MSQIDELEARLDTLTVAILVPMRTSKHVNPQELGSLNNLVKDLISEIGDATVISRRLAGKLWFIFTQMLTEADHARSPEEILRGAWSYQEQLESYSAPGSGQENQLPGCRDTDQQHIRQMPAAFRIKTMTATAATPLVRAEGSLHPAASRSTAGVLASMRTCKPRGEGLNSCAPTHSTRDHSSHGEWRW